MAQFDLYRNPNPDTAENVPYLLDVQNDLLASLTTRVVVPLIKSSTMPRPLLHLNPVFEVEGSRLVMSTAELAGLPMKSLGEKTDSLVHRRDEIISAIDFLITGI